MHTAIEGAGLGLRRSFINDLANGLPEPVRFLEIAPENWLHLGGKYQRQLSALSEQHPFVCHGLSLSIGGPAPLDWSFLKRIKSFLEQHKVAIYSEHLSYCAGHGHLYDLMPIPFTEEAIHYVASRVRQVQDFLERPLVLENVSYYAAPGQQMPEIDFINAVLAESDCQLLLDVNNIFVNACNHGYDAAAFLRALPSQRIAYGHIAGHSQQQADVLIDTHGSDVIEPVWALQQLAYRLHGIYPTLLERDFNIPSLTVLIGEVSTIHRLQNAVAKEVA
ncbi:HvfB family MNIO-type RiPP peptide maturase [Gallaecimonas mangrovi]|uniref:HvfB family MNIO-type RiPP peptide maturase n=1 Tax=Gallaecimonas mangrovi TaxID=2291597 RepID=UPI000E1FF43D|nr:DUF692 domain-containing protein [Gallaecimonas mangrovi]